MIDSADWAQVRDRSDQVFAGFGLPELEDIRTGPRRSQQPLKL